MEILYTVGDETRFVYFDATVRELHGTSAMVTEHVVERGVAITDHIRPERDRLSVEVHVTNSPIRSPNVDGAEGRVRALEVSTTQRTFSRTAKVNQGGEVDPAEQEQNSTTLQANVMQYDQPFDRVGAVYQTLQELAKAGAELTVVTSLRQYDSMAIADLGAPREGPQDSITFTMELVEIRFAESDTVDVTDPLETRAERRRRRGAQGTEDPASGEERSLAAAMVEDWGGIGLIHSNTPRSRTGGSSVLGP